MSVNMSLSPYPKQLAICDLVSHEESLMLSRLSILNNILGKKYFRWYHQLDFFYINEKMSQDTRLIGNPK